MNAEFWKSALRQILAVLWPQIGGWKLWVLNKFLDFGGSWLHDYVGELKRKAERENEQLKAEPIKDAVINNPEHTAEEAGKAYEDYFNSGRGN